MLTYTPPESRLPAPHTYEKPWIGWLLIFAWLWPGVFSHDLWRPSEPWVNEAVKALLAGGSIWLPTVFDEPYFSVSPVYVWVAAMYRRILSPDMTDAYSAMRFASVTFTAIGLAASNLAGKVFLGRQQNHSVALILIGCAGLIMAGHFLGGMSVQFAAAGLCLYGLALARKRVIVAATLLGVGWALAALSAGYLMAVCLMLIAFVLPISTAWQVKRYTVSLVGALAVSVPLMLIYPLALYHSSPTAFTWWQSYQMLGTFGGTASFSLGWSAWYYLKNLLWFAFPALPLAVWSFSRGQWKQQDWGVLAGVWLTLLGALLCVEPIQYQDNLIWLLPPLALLGAAKLDSLRRGAAAFLNWFGIMTFGLFALFLWLGFLAMNFGFPAKLAERAAYFSPYFVPDIDTMPMLVASLFTPLWLWAITRKHVKGRQAVTNWAAGMTLVWALLMTLFLPWLDAAKSYRPVVEQMQAALPTDFVAQQACIQIEPAAKTIRLAWGEYSNLPLRLNDRSCRYRLIQTHQQASPPEGWRAVWQGGRPRNREEWFMLLEPQP